MVVFGAALAGLVPAFPFLPPFLGLVAEEVGLGGLLRFDMLGLYRGRGDGRG